jgi:dienelactone hydrolase
MSSVARVPLPAAVLAALLLIVPGPSPAQSPGPQGAARGKHREQLWLVPTDDGSGRLMRTIVYRPDVETPRRLVVINHGAPTTGPATLPQPRFPAASAWFADRGYVVAVPQRRGYGETGGTQNESYGSCQNADFATAGREGARDIAATVAFMRRQPFVRPEGTYIIGQSAGGWATLAYSSLNPPGVPAMINFAGGRGGWRNNIANNNCSPDNLARGAGDYGRTARVPTLWIYTENDSFFDPGLSRRMADAYRRAGGNVQYELLAPFRRDGHGLFESVDGVGIWSPLVRAFIGQHR